MSYNEIAETFSEYSKGKSSNCQHLIELFQQAMIQMEEEEELLIVEHPRTQLKNQKEINRITFRLMHVLSFHDLLH